MTALLTSIKALADEIAAIAERMRKEAEAKFDDLVTLREKPE